MRDLPEEVFLDAVKSSKTVLEALRKMGYTYTGGTARVTFKKICQERNIDISHLCNHAGGKHLLTNNDIFVENSEVCQNSLRRHYLDGNYSEYKCAICGINEWNGRPLTLRLDHINGHNKDNRIENLRWVCPNCDSQLPTFCSGHKGLFKYHYYCIDCGKEVSIGIKRCYECNVAFLKSKEIPLPDREELKSDLYLLTRKELMQKYNVCDKTITKWCNKLGLPHKLREIHKYTKEEWNDEIPYNEIQANQ